MCVCVCVRACVRGCARGCAGTCAGGVRFSNSNRITHSDYRILLLLKMHIPNLYFVSLKGVVFIIGKLVWQYCSDKLVKLT